MQAGRCLLVDFYFYVTIMVALALLYYGYDKKLSYDLKAKELELEHKKLELEIIKLNNGINEDKDTQA